MLSTFIRIFRVCKTIVFSPKDVFDPSRIKNSKTLLRLKKMRLTVKKLLKFLQVIVPAPKKPIGQDPIEKPKILFALLSGSMFSSVASVISAARESDDAITQVMLFENHYLNQRTQEFFQLKEHLTNINIPFSYYSEKAVLDFYPDVVILVVPYFDMYPSEFWSFINKRAKIVYIPYGLEAGGGALNHTYQFNSLVQKKAWRIYVRSNNTRRMYARYKDNGNANVVVTGSARTDLYQDLDDIGNKELRDKIGDRIAILWTPHFSVVKDDEPNFWSSFLYLKNHILQAFVDRSDSHFLIFRPHPLLWFRLLEMGIWGIEQIDEFKSKILELGNSFIDEDSNYMHAFKESDAIITDAGSFLLEYLWVNKPILYTFPPDGCGLSDDARPVLKAVSLLGDSPDEGLNDFLSGINDKSNPSNGQYELARKAIFYRPESGNSVGAEIIKNIINSCKKGDFFIPPLHRANADELAESFWETANNTYFASAEFYDRQESAFKKILDKIGFVETAVDIGCGDGRYTFILSQKAKHVHASDISEKLLIEARDTANKKSITNITFFNDSILDIKHLGRYDFVSCMGVLSGVVSEARFARALYTLKALVYPEGGKLLLKESFSKDMPKYLTSLNGYTCVYRKYDHYVYSIKSLGFELMEKFELGNDEKNNMVSYLLLFELKQQS